MPPSSLILDRTGRPYPSLQQRTITWDDFIPPDWDWSYDAVNIGPKGSYRLSSVYACIKLIADAIAATPLNLKRLTRTEINGTDRETFTMQYQGQLALLARRPAKLYNRFTFWQTMISLLCGWGNAYALIVRNASGQPMDLVPVHPQDVSVITIYQANPLAGEYTYNYQATVNGRTYSNIQPEDMIHLIMFSYDGIEGVSPIRLHRDTMSISDAQTKYGEAFYRTGAKITGVIESELKTSRGDSEEFVDWFNNLYTGSKGGRVGYLPGGAKFKNVSAVNPIDAEFVNSRKLTRQEIAAIFRVPLYLLGDMERATWNNLSSLGEEFVRYTLTPHYTLIQDELNRKLIGNSNLNQFVFDPTKLVAGNMADRFNSYSTAIQGGFMSRSEARLREGMAHVDELDEFWQPLNTGGADNDEDPEAVEPTRSVYNVANGQWR